MAKLVHFIRKESLFLSECLWVIESTRGAIAAGTIRIIVSIRDFCSDVYAGLVEVRRDLAQASGVVVNICLVVICGSRARTFLRYV